MTITNEITNGLLVARGAKCNQLKKFNQYHPNGLDISGLWSEDPKIVNDTWIWLLTDTFLNFNIGWAIGVGILPSAIRADLSGQSIIGANVDRGNFTGSPSLEGVNLSFSELNWADFGGCNLAGADLSDTRLRGACLVGANLNRVNLLAANLSGANLSGASLIDARLVGAKLIGANLLYSNLTRADLTNANLTGANLTDVLLSGADLTGAILDWANLADVDLSRAHGVDLTKVNKTDSLPHFKRNDDGSIA